MKTTTTTSTNSSNFNFDYNKETGTLSGGFAPSGTSAEPNYYEYCWYRLPCGICTRTNSMCPLGKGEVTWEYNKITCDSNSGISGVASSKSTKSGDWWVSLDATSANVPSTPTAGFSSEFNEKDIDSILKKVQE